MRPIREQMLIDREHERRIATSGDRPLTQADVDLLNDEEDEFRDAVAPQDRPSLSESIFLLLGLEIGACAIILFLCVQLLGGFE